MMGNFARCTEVIASGLPIHKSSVYPDAMLIFLILKEGEERLFQSKRITEVGATDG